MQAALTLCAEEEPQAAERLAGDAAARIKAAEPRAELLGGVARWCLERGIGSSLVLPAYEALLQVADADFESGRHKDAAASFAAALRLFSHRVLHFDSLRSPLADDPVGFSAPLRVSRVAAAMRAPRGRSTTGSSSPGSSTVERPARLLVATRINADFLGEIRKHFDDHPRFDMRFVDFQEVHELDRFAKNPERIVFQTLAGKPGIRRTTEEAFREHLDWADVVFVEWCTALAALLTQVDPSDTRVVVRMHSYEAFTLWPHLMDFSRVDDLVFVSDHLRDLAVAAIPGLQEEDAPSLHVIANAMELQRFVRPKRGDDTRFTLGVIGASKMVKDSRWAVEVVRQLRRYDERYRLVLVRGTLQDPTPAAQTYAEALQCDLDELVPSGAVRVLGHTDDVPAVLQEIGVVLSSSVRESFHMGLVEAVASGALPVVRDWPFFPGAARQLFPDEWVVDSPRRAAERILALASDADAWREAAGEAARYVLERWDWPIVRRGFEDLFDHPKPRSD